MVGPVCKQAEPRPTDARQRGGKSMSFGDTSPTSRNIWRATLWADRIGLVLLAWWGWRHFARFRTSDFVLVGALAVGGVLFHQVARSHALGWVIDDNGERQKVTHWIRGQPVYFPTTRSQRTIEEAEMNHDRRRALFWSAVIGWPLLYAGGFLYRHHHPTLSIAAYVVGWFTVLLVFAPQLFGEVLYQFGYQDMQGAKVLDPEPYRAGPADVARQRVHGDADVATAAEARDLLRGR